MTNSDASGDEFLDLHGDAPPSPNGNSADEIEEAEREFVRHIGDVASEAVKAQREHGLPIVFLRGRQIIKQYPDGREIVLATVPAVEYTIPEDVPLFEDS